MSDPEPTPQVGDDPKAEAQEATGADLESLRKELADARKEAAKYRTSLRAQEAAKEQAEKAELEKQGEYKKLLEQEQAERTKLAAEMATLQRKTLQHEAAAAAGLPLDLAARLIGETADELLADAQAMAKRLAPTGAPATGATNPAAKRTDKPEPIDPKNPPRLSSIQWKK